MFPAHNACDRITSNRQRKGNRLRWENYRSRGRLKNQNCRNPSQIRRAFW